eukprot:symbB.v1.2.001157.t1/scaffold47.1/size388503/12
MRPFRGIRGGDPSEFQDAEGCCQVNPSQRSAIDGLKFALEKIQGPPGTGKSTTIFHILDARVPPGSRVLVTCSRNVAVESIAQKLSGLEDWPLCVFGARDRVGEAARRYLLDSQVGIPRVDGVMLPLGMKKAAATDLVAMVWKWLHWLLFPGVFGFHVKIMVTSKLSSLDRRMTLRHIYDHCMQHVEAKHDVEQLFFLADVNDANEQLKAELEEEKSRFGDLIFVGGPDSDPSVERDVTYVLDRPTARGFRLALGTAWLAAHRTDLDFVMYLDDDSYLHIPRLLAALEVHNTPSLAMGYVMETQLDTLETHICMVCPTNCERCREDQFLQDFCSHFPMMSLGGCAFLVHQCKLFGHDEAEDTLEAWRCSCWWIMIVYLDKIDRVWHELSSLQEILMGLAVLEQAFKDHYFANIHADEACVEKAQRNTLKVSNYFGLYAPRWFLGMGWVFGKRIVDFLARNVADLKMHGAADVQLGFWLAPLEGIHWVDMKEGHFHDYPMPGSTFSRGCTEKTILVHRMNQERWNDFDTNTCELHCPLSATLET